SARVAVAVPCCVDANGKARAAAGVEIAVRTDVLRVEGIDTGPSSTVFVVDPEGRVIAHPREKVGAALSEHGAVAAFLRNRRAGTATYDSADGGYIAAFAPLGALGWAVLV